MVPAWGTGGCKLKIVEPSWTLVKCDVARNEILAAEFECAREFGDHNVAISDFSNGKFARGHANAGNRSERLPQFLRTLCLLSGPRQRAHRGASHAAVRHPRSSERSEKRSECNRDHQRSWSVRQASRS